MPAGNIESAEDLSAFFDIADFAVEATFTLAGPTTRVVLGIFENPIATRSVTQHIGVTTPAPTLTCRSVDLTGIGEGAACEVEGIDYVVRAIMSDGTGVSSLMLEIAA